MLHDKITFQLVSSSSCKVDRSRFLSFAEPCKSLDDIKLIVRKYRKKYHDAKHVCWAACIGNNDQRITQYSNDGEPSGTAGTQILQGIMSSSFTDVIVIVVRYFGGIKLGKKNLSDVYKTSAMTVINR